MNYIVLDLEWNQPYSKQKKYSNGVAVMSEVIQLGAVKLDSKLNIIGKFEKKVRPLFYRKITRHVRDITGLTNAELKCGVDFYDVYEAFERFCGEEFMFITWGADDLPVLRNNMEAHGINTDGLPDCINLQIVFNVEVSHDGRQWSLEGAMERLEIEQKLTAHDALSDAVNTVKIAKVLCDRKSVSRYSENGFIEHGKLNSIEEGFKTVREALSSKELCSLKCPICSKRLKTDRWVCSRYKKYSLFNCKKHGMFKVSLSARRTDDGYAVLKSITLASPEAVENYTQAALQTV